VRKRLAQVGELDQQVSIMAKTRTSDGAGGATVAEVTIAADLWAHVTPVLGGGEAQSSGRTESKGRYLVVIRNRSDVLAGHFVRWNGRDLNIRFPRARGSREPYLELECELGAAV
jgi:SPP1 family predicted phage head-tail adaptor